MAFWMDSPGPTTALSASAKPAPATRARASARLPASTHTERARPKVAFMFLSLVLSSKERRNDLDAPPHEVEQDASSEQEHPKQGRPPTGRSRRTS
jgi:hypothetical protein